MKNISKKIIALTICLLFLLTIAEVSVSKTISKKEYSKTKEIVETKTYTLYRYGNNGKITPVQVEIDITEDTDLSKVLEEKCVELFNEDEELQKNIEEIKNEKNNSNSSMDLGLFYIKSRGKGFHFKSKLLVKILTKILLFSIGLPNFKVNPKRRTIICNYRNDPNAYTNINPIISLKGENNNTFINGSHRVIAKSFRGYTTWLGRFSFARLLPRTFVGTTRAYAILK